MSTSLNIQGLSKYRNNFIFISKERTSRVEFDLKTLSQESIDNAFKKQARRTKALDQLNEYTIVLLETNYTNKYEIVDFNAYEISSVNKAFVEIISNIQYFQSPEVVIDLFKNIKENL